MEQNKREAKVLVAMSGGVDSSVAALVLREGGRECIGATMKLFDGDSRCCSLADVNDAREVCRRLGIPHYVLNFKREFAGRVMRRFVEVYQGGATPNPCIDCNRFIKFNALLFRAQAVDYGTLATGHYARIEKSGSRYLLKKGVDPTKDQSYVLYAMTQEELSKTLFPLGGMTKEEVRARAAAYGLVNAEKKDSQDICFVPDGDYGAFIERYTGRETVPGDILDGAGNVIGRHRGFCRYTIGQRRGLGVAGGSPLYVTAKSARDNTVTLGPDSALYSATLTASDLNLIACDRIDRPLRVKIKTRYLQKEVPAVITQIDDDLIRAEFTEPQRALTPGQAAVFYDNDTVIGGATICPPSAMEA
ncbi:MAG: tRNA 2-thiouridine(34) synthase MnmA [Spirochaetaceae bacterium]|jgi:tRNA-specific 2-thiouridylase|nr:tRNA 2-thiouridine(34) synthase MnmA [Spirochaetaceae bacterium]